MVSIWTANEVGWKTPVGILIGWETSAFIRITLTLVIFLLVIVLFRIILSNIPKKYNLSSIVPEGGLIICLGIIVGVILQYVIPDWTEARALLFNPSVFFLILLPPIVFDGGYFIEKNYLFRYLRIVLAYALIGTLIFALVYGFVLYGLSFSPLLPNMSKFSLLDYLLLAATLASTDPVAVFSVLEGVPISKRLTMMIVGPSIINDGISVVMYEVFFELRNEERMHGGSEVGFGPLIGWVILKFLYVFFGSIILGGLVALFFVFISRFSQRVVVLELLLLIFSAASSYYLAECFKMSGILSILTNAILASRYFEMNLTMSNHRSVKSIIRLVASTAESLIFLNVGIDLVSRELVFYWDLILFSVLFLVLVFYLEIFGITTVRNLFTIKSERITFAEQHIISYSGLRGAISFALILQIPAQGFEELRNALVTVVIIILLFTIIIQGSTLKSQVVALGLTKPLISPKQKLHYLEHEFFALHNIYSWMYILSTNIENGIAVGHKQQVSVYQVISIMKELKKFMERQQDTFANPNVSKYFMKNFRILWSSYLKSIPLEKHGLVIKDTTSILEQFVNNCYNKNRIVMDDSNDLFASPILRVLEFGGVCQIVEENNRKFIQLAKWAHDHVTIENIGVAIRTQTYDHLYESVSVLDLVSNDRLHVYINTVAQLMESVRPFITLLKRSTSFPGIVFTAPFHTATDAVKNMVKRTKHKKLLPRLLYYLDKLIVFCCVRRLNHEEMICLQSLQSLIKMANQYSNNVPINDAEAIHKAIQNNPEHLIAISLLARNFSATNVNIGRIFDAIAAQEKNDMISILMDGLLQRVYLGEAFTSVYKERAATSWVLHTVNRNKFGTTYKDFNEGEGYNILIKLLLRDGSSYMRQCHTEEIRDDFNRMLWLVSTNPKNYSIATQE